MTKADKTVHRLLMHMYASTRSLLSPCHKGWELSSVWGQLI